MTKTKIGSHNTFSYLRPKKWYMLPFWFVSKCQSKDIVDQYESGARIFDIRINFDKNYKFQISHGFMAFNISEGDVEFFLEQLNNLANDNNKIYIRLIYELNYDLDDEDRQSKEEDLFKSYCKKWQDKYGKLIFFGGNRKYDWDILFDFKTDAPRFVDLYSSTTGTVWDDWCPWLYATLHNKVNLEEYENDDKYVLMDFI